MVRTTPILLLFVFALTTVSPQPPRLPPTPACPHVHHQGPYSLIAMLYAAEYECTEEIARALMPVADADILDHLIRLTAPEFHSLTRRNALRVIGRWTEDPQARTVVLRNALALDDRLLRLVQHDPSDDVRADAIWILDTFFFPAHHAQSAFVAIALTPGSSANLRTPRGVCRRAPDCHPRRTDCRR
jgi:hypothetical protein